MSGPSRKPASKRQRTNKPRATDLRVVPEVEVPKPPPGLLKVTRDWWVEFWSSEFARVAVIDVHRPMVRRLASLCDERERCYQSARKGRLVTGSQGQPVLNPLYKHMSTLDAEIRQLEDRLGLSPRAGLNLGIQMGQMRRTLDDLNRDIEVDASEYLEVVDEEGVDSRAVGDDLD